MRKLHSSPTPPVVVLKITLTTFLIRHTDTPLTGPILKVASRAGSSEKSICTKDGIRNGIGNSSSCSTKAAAPSMAVITSLWVLETRETGTRRVFALVDIIIHSSTEIAEDNPSPEYLPQTSARIFFHPDCNCRYRICTGSTPCSGRGLGFRRTVTAGRDFHPALKMNDSVVVFYYTHLRKKCKSFFLFSYLLFVFKVLK